MQICPKCKQLIDDDSWYCDQCGAEIMVCPQCKTMKRGMRCNQCGAKLVSAKAFADSGMLVASSTTPPTHNVGQAPNTPQRTAPQPTPANPQPFAEQQPVQPNPQPTPAGQQPAQPNPQPTPAGQQPVQPNPQPTPAGQQPVQPNPQPTPAGQQDFERTIRPSAQPQPSSVPKHLICLSTNQRLGIGNGAIIGRRGDYAQVFAGQGFVSGTHARLQYNANGEFEVVDLDSTNGTFIGNDQLMPNIPKVVRVGDIVRFANMEFRAEV